MDAVLQLRGSNTATVKDIVDLQKLIVNHFKALELCLDCPNLKEDLEPLELA